ncbi:ABC-F family ATP-binding cassette domain-containing protein [Verrucomicrobiaceae bacterium R5-34]|uniref:ABC-F family ATP-binding cassette domain-containing protein n=1 Tax=Oceaniferula flava TaxID=2800421 RepID=A0AAE2SBS1_9BACT|nr:ABC-F family ATP-binding cassette domain-containing protein [Oceaniferula flavus]MBK1831367.1 ABC-F family ATP-binding cassette domain-containing protein [Verrucomicrobiaceae bacterium R5-34]MBK1854963.1 ABC-F family ATP-binding cassette domain-containing protein [Oceaniferula flavus]MBM1136269.1 ABC-F family ATP-binding cassette domain-containing protein [Oceaniferula flavus]
MLIIRKITKTVGGRTLFEDADMTINWGERVALVGPNGAGKSTLFKLILGEEESDSGSVERDDYAITGYLAQEAGDPGEETILEIAIGVTAELSDAIKVIREGDAAGKTDTPEYHAAQDTFDAANGYQLEPKAKKILAGLGFDQDAFDQPANKFSGGWIMRAHLAKLLVMEPDLLMLDEPTNHLDLMALVWLQQYLKTYPGALLMISHDRDFMDGLIETVYEIDEEKLISYTGNYTSYLEQRQKRYQQKVQAYRNQQKEIDRIQEFIDRFRSVTSKAAQVQSRVKQLEKIKRLPKPIKPRKVFKFNFPQPKRSNQKVIQLEKIHKAYGDKVIYESLDLTIERGDRMVLVGPNGAGKSTLLKILAGELEFESGERDCGYNTDLGYFSQHRTQTMNEANTVLEEVMSCGGDMREDEARSILGSFLFRRADVHKKIRVLSGGEKSRLSLVKFLVNPPNLLLMDEPTTHLDIISIEALLQALKHYEGTLVFISHDVHFIRNLAETTLHIDNGKLTRYAGGYDYYLEKSGLDDSRGAVIA